MNVIHYEPEKFVAAAGQKQRQTGRGVRMFGNDRDRVHAFTAIDPDREVC